MATGSGSGPEKDGSEQVENAGSGTSHVEASCGASLYKSRSGDDGWKYNSKMRKP